MILEGNILGGERRSQTAHRCGFTVLQIIFSESVLVSRLYALDFGLHSSAKFGMEEGYSAVDCVMMYTSRLVELLLVPKCALLMNVPAYYLPCVPHISHAVLYSALFDLIKIKRLICNL